MLAQALERAGHEAVWWVSNFEHRTKRFRTAGYEERAVSPGFRLHIVPSVAYTSNVSLGRIRFEKKFAAGFSERAGNYPPPDVIVLADPALFASRYVVAYARGHGVKLIVDVLDLWPDLFHLVLPRQLAWAGHAIFYPLYRRRAWLFRQACGLVAVSQDYLDIAQKVAPDTSGEVVYLGVDLDEFRRVATCSEFLDSLALPAKDPEDIWVIYAGTLGVNYDIKTILDSSEILREELPRVRIMIAGEGPLRELVTDSIRDRRLDNVTYLGSLAADKLTALYGQCDIALSTYRGLSTVSMPVKAFDYLAAGLPVVNSLGKDWGRLVEAEKVGIQYESENSVSLAQAIMRLAARDDSYMRMRTRAMEVSKRFDSGRQHDSFVKFIEKVVR